MACTFIGMPVRQYRLIEPATDISDSYGVEEGAVQQNLDFLPQGTLVYDSGRNLFETFRGVDSSYN
jgi:hypothetical protein